ncbi:O-antigen translocase [Edwardsiella tarda]|uniref:O-antigen translocase n=1 Tax=Edwardsiella tarda TaxID=636 RepID=UPI003F65FC12
MTGLLTLLKMVMGFVIAKVVAIYTGPTGMAMLGQVQSLVGSLNGVVSAPGGSGVVRFTAERGTEGFESCAPWWRAALQWTLILLAIVIPVGLLLSEYIAIWLFDNIKLSWVVVITVCALPLSALGSLCNSVINGQQKYRRYIALGAISVLLSSSMMWVMIAIENIQGALLAAALQSALIGFVMLIANFDQPWFRFRYWFGSCNIQARKDIARYVMMAITSAIMTPLSLILVRMILIDKVGWDNTGQWQAVWKVSEVYLSVITMALGTYYLPKLSSLIGVDVILSEINKTALVVIPIVSVMALLIYFFRDIIISILFTDGFNSARDLFFFQLIGDVIKIVCWLYAYPMLSRGAIRWFVSIEVVFSFSFVILTYILVDKVGIDGVTIAYLVNYLICLIVILLNIRKFSR